MEELKKMMREMAVQIKEKADELGLENFNLEVSYAKVTGKYEILEVECVNRAPDEDRVPRWYFDQVSHNNGPWMDYTSSYNDYEKFPVVSA